VNEASHWIAHHGFTQTPCKISYKFQHLSLKAKAHQHKKLQPLLSRSVSAHSLSSLVPTVINHWMVGTMTTPRPQAYILVIFYILVGEFIGVCIPVLGKWAQLSGKAEGWDPLAKDRDANPSGSPNRDRENCDYLKLDGLGVVPPHSMCTCGRLERE